MGETPTIAIHSPKNHADKWFINRSDFDPSVHQVWDDDGDTKDVEPEIVMQEDAPVVDDDPGVEYIDPVVPDMPVESHDRPPTTPSVPDFITDYAGDIVGVNIIDPERRTSRRQVSMEEYDPDKHELWSTHPRFNR